MQQIVCLCQTERQSSTAACVLDVQVRKTDIVCELERESCEDFCKLGIVGFSVTV